MEKRFQVFVSSTYEDLQVERHEVMQALLELDCIPAGMELFPAANDDQWTLIKKVIDDSDYYIVISAGRYGSLGPEGLSYTEMEYRYALEKGKPIIGFLHKKPDEIAVRFSEKDKEGKEKLEAFRSLIKKKMVKYWDNPENLGAVVSRGVSILTNTNPAVGWIRADCVPNEANVIEILKLKKRIEELENELRKIKNNPPSGAESLAQGEDAFLINYSFTAYNYSSLDKQYSASFKTTWNDIFMAIAPTMIDEIDEYSFITRLNEFIKSQQADLLLKTDELKSRKVKDFKILQETYFIILIQLRALGLIQKSNKAHSVKDTVTYWTLTQYGDNLMTKLMAISKKKPKKGFSSTEPLNISVGVK